MISGAGCFGLSSAYHLLKSGYTNIVVVDQSDTLPAPNAASTDLNKIGKIFGTTARRQKMTDR